MNYRLLNYFFISLLFLIPTTSFAGLIAANGGLLPIAETDTTNFQLYSFYDLRNRESFIQVTNTGTATTMHVQIFDVGNLCNENNFIDTYTPSDTHVYNMRDIQTNNGNNSGVELPDNAYGFVVVTVVLGQGQPADSNGSIIGNFRVIDNAGYEYRTNSQGFNFQPGGVEGSLYFINYNSVSAITKSDVVGITVDNITSGEVTASGSSVTFDTTLINNNEVLFSCSDTIFSCTENTFEYGINEAIPHSRDKSVVCESNNISEGLVRFEVISDTDIEAFAGFVGINTGNSSRGSMDSIVAERTPICGDGILDTNDDREECDDGNNIDGDGCESDCTITPLECPLEGDCCRDNGTPGCEDCPCQELVCANDPFCCNVSWDSMCAADASIVCSTCGGEPPPEVSDCCTEGGNGTPGCDDMTCQDLICGADPFCCDTSWDGICATAAQVSCDICDIGDDDDDNLLCPAGGDCCTEGGNGTPGCEDCPCQELVCANDPFCCEISWDGICAADASIVCSTCF